MRQGPLVGGKPVVFWRPDGRQAVEGQRLADLLGFGRFLLAKERQRLGVEGVDGAAAGRRGRLECGARDAADVGVGVQGREHRRPRQSGARRRCHQRRGEHSVVSGQPGGVGRHLARARQGARPVDAKHFGA